MSEAAGSVKVILAADASSYSAALTLAQKQLDQLQGSVTRAGHATVSQMQAASASIRLFEGGMTNNIRAVERFITTIPGVGAALKAAFPIVGGIALAGLFVKLGSEAYKFIETARQIPQALQSAFQASNLSITTTNDELRKSNDQLANQIALLEGKPANNTAIALDDARIAADKLAKSLEQDNKQLTELLKANALNPFAALLTGQAPTGASADAVKSWAAELQRRSNNVVIAQHQYGVGSTQDTAAQAALAQSQKDAEAEIGKRLAAAQRTQADYIRVGAGRGIENQSGNIDILQGYQAQLYGRDDEASLEKTNAQESAKKQQLEDAKKFAAQQAEAQRKINDQTHQDSAALVAMRRENADQMDEYSRTPGLIAPHGLFGLNGQQAGAPTAVPMEAQSLATSPDFTKGQEEQGKALAAYLKNLNEGVAIQKQNAAAFAESSLQMAVATGQMIKLDAAQVQAQIHTDEYNDTLTSLRDALANVGNLGLSADEQKAKTSELNNQISQLTGARSVQAMQDEANIRAATVMGQLSTAVADLANKFTDFGSQLASLTVNTIQAYNQTLSTALMAHAVNGREYRAQLGTALVNTTRGVASSGLNSAMQMGEGSLLKMLTGNNPLAKLGTKDNPMYTRSADGVSSTAGAGGLLSKLFSPSGSSSGDSSDSSSGAGSIFDSFISGIAGFANGGDTPSNMPMLVGENGPEIFNPGVVGHIIPNSKLTGGSSSSPTIHIDARGSNDPAQVEAAIHRAMPQYLSMAVGASLNATQQYKQRRPASAR
jgi:hypothetical protein